ncbi:ubiquitinyl hydrolase [Fragilaria crotonensis]|nr:ubiquitinyl hydrolase [Fragilaria crotonensis]
MTDEDDDYDEEEDDEDDEDDPFGNVASMPDKDDFDDEDEDYDDDDYGKFKSALGKRNLEDFVAEQTTANANKRLATDLLMPFLNVESGAENAVTTEGILPLIDILELPRTRTCCRARETASALAYMPMLHIQQKDKWSCGYRNVQMLLSALIPLLPSDHPYHQCVPASLRRSDLGVAGARHYQGTIVDKDDKIGAIEALSILAAVRLDTVVLQFIKTHESRRLLSPFIWSYFGKRAGCDCRSSITSISEPHRPSAWIATNLLDYAATLPKEEVEHNLTCTCPSVPLYLQWEGHSVTVIGIRKIDGDAEYQLLILDPAKDGSAIHRHLGHAFELPTTLNAIEPLILETTELADKDCQILMATKRALEDSDIDLIKERVNAVTAARESVVQFMGRAGAAVTEEKRKDGDNE